MLLSHLFAPLLTALFTLPTTSASPGPYNLTDDLSYENFFPNFSFFSSPDPTEGFVQYQSLPAAITKNLTGFVPSTGSIYLGVDSTTRDPKGRASLRVESRKTFNHGLLIADIRHMPASVCGTWPAFWMLSAGKGADGRDVVWPDGGEIDILEGVNEQRGNAVTLHSSKGCVVDNATTTAMIGDGGGGGTQQQALSFSGTLVTDDCDVNALGQTKNAGCSIHAADSLLQATQASNQARGIKSAPPPASYGTPFNAAFGGVYAMQYTPTTITVWFFPRNSPSYNGLFPPTPNSNTNSNSPPKPHPHAPTAPNPSTWPTPLAHFASSTAACAFDARFHDLKIIFDTTFCGQWAGREWEGSGCARRTGVASCEAWVEGNPEAFREAYWEVGGLWWYERGE